MVRAAAVRGSAGGGGRRTLTWRLWYEPPSVAMAAGARFMVPSAGGTPSQHRWVGSQGAPPRTTAGPCESSRLFPARVRVRSSDGQYPPPWLALGGSQRPARAEPLGECAASSRRRLACRVEEWQRAGDHVRVIRGAAAPRRPPGNGAACDEEKIARGRDVAASPYLASRNGSSAAFSDKVLGRDAGCHNATTAASTHCPNLGFNTAAPFDLSIPRPRKLGLRCRNAVTLGSSLYRPNRARGAHSECNVDRNCCS